MDNLSKEKRSECMSKIRSKNTKPELALRKALFVRGFRFRVNDKNLAGKPDIVLSKYKTVIFVHGCFWHKHEGCKYAYTPKSNTKFWIDKMASNIERDKTNIEKLRIEGWNVLIVWECKIRHAFKHDISPLIDKLANIIQENNPHNISMKFHKEIENKTLMVDGEVSKKSQLPVETV